MLIPQCRLAGPIVAGQNDCQRFCCSTLSADDLAYRSPNMPIGVFLVRHWQSNQFEFTSDEATAPLDPVEFPHNQRGIAGIGAEERNAFKSTRRDAGRREALSEPADQFCAGCHTL